ncbi:MAG: retropepsin-like domain-containing protein [Phycisphaerales bacterium]|nr:MAG: retropepsin-like domain-containing protein [Phycisphaerales bacterium]
MRNALQISLSLLVVFPLVATSCRSRSAQDYFEVPLTFTDTGLPVITAIFTDTPVSFIVDTGSNRCLIDSATSDTLDLPPICTRSSGEVVIQGETVEQVHVHDVSFTIESRVFIVRTLRIAELPGGPVDGIQGILGMDFLRAAHAVVDIERERLVIRKPTSPRAQSNDNHATRRTNYRRR